MKIAVVGHGYWGKNIARVLHQSNYFELHTVCDQNPKQAGGIKKSYPNAHFIQDVKEIPDEVEAVALITPVNLHYELADYFLSKGKHVLLTKPFCETYEQSKMLTQKAKEVDRCLFVDHTFLFNPAIATLKKYIGKIGTPLFVMSQRLNLGLYRPEVNVISDLIPHDISIVSALFDSPIAKANTDLYYAAKMPQGDIAHSSFTLENGLNGIITVSWLSPFKIRQFSIIGSSGMLHYDDNAVMEKVKFFDTAISIEDLKESNNDAVYTSRISYRSGDMYSPGVPSYEALNVEMKEFQAAIENKTTRDYYSRINLQIMKGLEVVQNSVENKKENL